MSKKKQIFKEYDDTALNSWSFKANLLLVKGYLRYSMLQRVWNKHMACSLGMSPPK